MTDIIICGIDPNPLIPRQCVCDLDPEIMCEFPCWQRDGLDDQYDPTNPKSCCCYREGSKYKPKTNDQLEKERVEFGDWLRAKGYI